MEPGRLLVQLGSIDASLFQATLILIEPGRLIGIGLGGLLDLGPLGKQLVFQIRGKAARFLHFALNVVILLLEERQLVLRVLNGGLLALVCGNVVGRRGKVLVLLIEAQELRLSGLQGAAVLAPQLGVKLKQHLILSLVCHIFSPLW